MVFKLAPKRLWNQENDRRRPGLALREVKASRYLQYQKILLYRMPSSDHERKGAVYCVLELKDRLPLLPLLWAFCAAMTETSFAVTSNPHCAQRISRIPIPISSSIRRSLAREARCLAAAEA